MLKEYCKKSYESPDLFVGMRFHEGIPEVVFPHGFDISNDDKECRKDIFKLLSVLNTFSQKKEGDSFQCGDKDISNFPLESYQYIIQDFLSHGYYVEKEIRYVQAVRGKINWKRTIQQEKASIDGENVVYLKFQTKTNQINENNIITQIHKYCVYYSFYLFGWLYLANEYLPEKPQIPFNKKYFLDILGSALSRTFNDQKRQLFKHMINIINDQQENMKKKDIAVGVNRFDPIWEKLVDYIFGSANKEKYFPHATWNIIRDGKIEKSSALEPDTIMKWNDKIFVLDAKYYKYGITYHTKDLPPTSSIQKQITYGKHIAENFTEVQKQAVYNAFIMPYTAGQEEKMKFVSVGTADWEIYNQSTLNYAYVLGILIDTKWLISQYSFEYQKEVERLACLIEDSLNRYRKINNE